METIQHTLSPVFNESSRILILGTMPSPLSRKYECYYGNPRNRFWDVMSKLFNEDIPLDPKLRNEFVLNHNIALWDVLASCEIQGAQDSSIRNPIPNDLSYIINAASIQAICTTGAKANMLYNRYCVPSNSDLARIPQIELPSTSPANARASLEDLVEAYKKILAYL